MKVRHKQTGAIGFADTFSGMSEIVVGFESPPDMTSDFISSYDVFLPARGEWKDMHRAFKDRDLIPDNYNTRFFEPRNEEERARGWGS